MGGPGTCYGVSPASELIGCGGLRGEVKHLSTRRRRYSVSSGERKRMMVKPCACDTRQGLRVRGCGAVLWSSAGGRVRVLAGEPKLSGKAWRSG